jgi:hypothetical protein
VNDGKLNPTAMTVDEAAALLHVDSATVRAFIDAGLPVTDEQTLHLVEFTAWLVKAIVEELDIPMTVLAGGESGSYADARAQMA